MIKVTFVGAGSIEFTRDVVTDLCSYPEFHGGLHLSLYDISAERLAHAERLARRISAQTGGGAEVSATADQRAALAGADYVINEVQAGGYPATRADFDIPARYGVRQTIGDTQAFLTSLVGADPGRVRFLTAGFNHQAFVLRFEQDGESLYPRLAAIIESSPQLQRRVRVEIFRRFGYFPTESSEHSAEYVPWFMHHDSQIQRFQIFVGDYLARSEENVRELQSLQRDLASGAPLDLTPAGELASLFIHSLHVNIRNGGLISSLPTECCVEVLPPAFTR